MAEEYHTKWENGIEWSSSSDDEDSIRSIFCLKKRTSFEEFDKVEDCYILEFDPFEKLSLEDDDSKEFSVHRSQVSVSLDFKHLIDCVVKEERLIRMKGIESSSSSEDEGSYIGSIFCLKKNVSTEKFDEVNDCYILDFDPFESVDLDKLSLNDDDAEELSVIAQRGKVACLDFPHSRHLCAKFPFYKTPHEDHCEQCYCYVCDSAAPCKSWKSPGRHCDATEHDESWRSLRRRNVPAAPIADH